MHLPKIVTPAMVLDQPGHLAHFHARGTSFAAVSIGPLASLQAYRARMGWDVPASLHVAGDLCGAMNGIPASERAARRGRECRSSGDERPCRSLRDAGVPQLGG